MLSLDFSIGLIEYRMIIDLYIAIDLELLVGSRRSEETCRAPMWCERAEFGSGSGAQLGQRGRGLLRRAAGGEKQVERRCLGLRNL